MSISVSLPIRTVSLTNQRGHWARKARRARVERNAARWTCVQQGVGVPRAPLVITLTRFAPRKLDSDNVCGALKSIRDGVADALGIDDGSDLITWVYAQEKAKDYSVSIRIERKQ